MNEPTKQKFSPQTGMSVAAELCAVLEPACEKIAVAGSLRRGKQAIGDLELLFIGKTESRPDPDNMFGAVSVNLADEAIAALEKSGVLERRENINGSTTYGPKNKLMRHVKTGLPVDLFATTPENWCVSLVIRTGSKETNLRLTTGAQKRGRSLMAYGCGVRESDGNIIPATSEQHVFELCGVEYLEPEKR